jgi:hypothetical protein
VVNGVVTHVVTEPEIAEGALVEWERRRFFEEPIPDFARARPFERESGEEFLLGNWIPKQPIESCARYGGVGVDPAPVAEESAELCMLAWHVLPLNHGELERWARRALR